MKSSKPVLLAFHARASLSAPFGRKYDVEALKSDNLIGERLSQARKALGLSQKDVVEQLKAYNVRILPSAYCKWEQGYTFPGVYQLLALCSILRIENPLSFFLSPDARPEQPALNRKGMEKLCEYYELLCESGRYAPDDASIPAAEEIEKRVYDLPASAGTGLFLEDDRYSMLSFPASSLPADADFGVRVSGDSMLPRYVSGQIAWVERCSALNNGEIGIFVCNGDAFIKKYAERMPDADELERYEDIDGCVRPKIALISLNPAYADIEIGPETDLRIVGRVLN